MFKTNFINILLVIIVFIFSGCSKKNEDSEFKIGTNVWTGYEPLHLAKSYKMLSDKVDVQSYESATIVLNKFRKGEVQAAALTLDEVILLKDQGYNPVIVAIMDISNGADVIIANKKISSLSELKGKNIGVENSALGSYVLTRALEMASLKREDIKIISLGVDKHLEAFKSEVVDAVITFEPVRSELLAFGAHEIFSSKDIPNEIIDVLVVDKNYVKNQKVQGIIEAWSRASIKMVSKDEDAVKTVSKRLNQSTQEFIASLDGLKIPSLEESNRLIKDGTIETSILKIEKVMLENGLITSKIDIQSLLYK